MGFFSRIFKKEKIKDEPFQTEAVTLSSIQSWFLEQTRPRFKDLEKNLAKSLENIAGRKEELKKAIKKLNDATLPNPNIPEKERQVMEGNKKSFLQQQAIFISQLGIPESSYDQTLKFTKEFEDNVKTLAKSTSRNTQVLRYFFEQHVIEINKIIKQIHDEVESMIEQLHDESKGVTYVEEIQEKIDDLVGKSKHMLDLKKRLDEEHMKKENSQRMKKKLEGDVESIKSQPAYADFEQLNTQRDSIANDMRQIDTDLHHVFSQIAKPLRKYQRVATEHEKLIAEYETDPVYALLSDDDLLILEILKGMKASIAGGSIELKQSDREKSLQRIEKLNRQFFDQYTFRHRDLRRFKKKIDDKIGNNRLLRQLDDKTYKLCHTEEQISRADAIINEINQKISKLGLEHMKEELEHELRILLQKEVEINLDR